MSAEDNKDWQALKADYLRDVEKALASVRHPQSREVLENVGSHLDQRFAEMGSIPPTRREMEAIIEAMGPASDYSELLDPGTESAGRKPIATKHLIIIIASTVLSSALLVAMVIWSSYQSRQGNPIESEKRRIVDKIDYPFVDDPAAVGTWQSVDFVQRIEDFKPTARNWSRDLYLKGMRLFPRGGTDGSWTWTKGLILDPGNKTAARYEIKRLDNATYMFFEWKSGDYTIRHMKPRYYVLKKTASTTTSPGAIRGSLEESGGRTVTGGANMNGKLVFVLLLGGIGLLEAALAVPLFLDKVPPNGFYGFRTEKTLSRPDVWYKVNRFSGRDMLVGGLATIGLAVGLLFFRKQVDDYLLVITCILAINLVPVIVIARGLIYLKRL